MSNTLFFISNKSLIEYNYLKVKESLKDIKMSHHKRTDLISSMTETETDLLSALSNWKIIQEKFTILQNRLIALEQQNNVLLNENRELKRVNKNIINDINL